MAVYQVYPNRKKKYFGFLENLSLTMKLILINIFCFILFSILISTGIIGIDSIAIKPENILQGKYIWTFLTSMFMHGSFFHIFANMLSLYFIGTLIERILGRKRYLTFYLLAGLFAGLFFVFSSFVFPQDLSAYAVGASGALFGIAGLMVILTPNLPLSVMFIPIPIKAKYAIPGLLLLLWVISITANVGIGNTAHLGGLLFGLVYGIILRNKFPNKIKYISRHFS